MGEVYQRNREEIAGAQAGQGSTADRRGSSRAFSNRFKIVSPFPEEYYPLVWALLQEFARETMDDRSPRSLPELIEKDRRDRESGGLSYAIVGQEGVPLGAVWCEAIGDGLGIGHLVFMRRELTSGEKLSATRAAVSMMFAAGMRKICWSLFGDNRLFHIFLRRLGAVEEGRLKDQVRRNGELVDMVLMASFPQQAEIQGEA
jgi:RimJ/RimL family protein N-acetyltransferase